MDKRRQRKIPQHHLTLTLERQVDDTFTATLKVGKGRMTKKDIEIHDWVNFLLTLRDQFEEVEEELENSGV